MRTTTTIDDALYQQAIELAEPDIDKAGLFREAIKTFVRVQTAKRLIALGGSAPQMQDIPRRLPDWRAELKAARLMQLPRPNQFTGRNTV